MKKILLVGFIFISLQTVAQKSFFGVDAGVNVANQRIKYAYVSPLPINSFYYQNIVRPTFGFFYQYSVSKILALRCNVQYMGLGYRTTPRSGLSYSTTNSVNINYLTFPVSIQYSVNEHLRLNTGAYLSFTIGGTKLYNQDITKTYHKNDYGFSIGAEHDLYKNFALSVNYFVGLKNTWLDDQGGTTKYTNRALQFTLIYKLKRKS